MPEFEALYYPNLQPPATWLRNFLLFFDKIKTIVPEGVNFKLSQENSEIINLIPDAFETIPPEEKDIFLDDFNLSRFRKAFKIIKNKESDVKSKKDKIVFLEDECIHMAGRTILYDKKISDKVRNLLKHFKFIESEHRERADSRGAKYYIANESASDLIVSHIADNIASRYGWNTVTDRQIDFTVNALNAFEWVSVKDRRNLLVCSIINCEIPQEIQKISLERYNKIRDKYADMREHFHHLAAELSNVHRLEKTKDEQTLRERINRLTYEFNEDVEEFKNSKIGREFKRWAPISIGSITTIITAAIGGPIVAIPCAVVSVAIQVIQELSRKKEPRSMKEEVCRLIAGMQKDIIEASKIRDLI